MTWEVCFASPERSSDWNWTISSVCDTSYISLARQTLPESQKIRCGLNLGRQVRHDEGHFWVFFLGQQTCWIQNPAIHKKTQARSMKCVRLYTVVYSDILLYTLIYSDIFFYTLIYSDIFFHTPIYSYILLYTLVYSYILFYTHINLYTLIYIYLYTFI